MKLLITAALISSALSGCVDHEQSKSRQSVDLNTGWRFIRDTIAENLYEKDIDDIGWVTVTLPHTPRIEALVVNNQWQGIAWYRKYLTIDKEAAGKKVFIRFDAAMQVADVWINGKHKITHLGGYLPFIVDISDDIVPGENVLAVRLDNLDNPQVPPGKPLKTLDFYFYGGIYRDVTMIITDNTHITDPIFTAKRGEGGIFITYDSISKAKAILSIRTNVKNENQEDATVTLKNVLSDTQGNAIATVTTTDFILQSESDEELLQTIELDNPVLWYPDNPCLYSLKTEIINNNTIIDEIETRFGVRKTELKSDGFYINDEKFFINGTNRHQEYPYIGYALSDEAQYRDALKIKNAGFDLVRLSHYPQSDAFLDACDELGLLVMDCIPGWQFMGDDAFRMNSLDDCRNLIRRDRNHPSVVFWEVSLNETAMDEEFMDEANLILDEELSKDAISAGWIDNKAYDLFIPARQHAQPPDYWNRYRVGGKALFIAEYGDWEYFAQNAGINQTAYKDLKPEERTSRQLRGSGEKGMLQQALNFQEAANSNLKGNFTIGQANWLMFDYNRGYADDIEASGISDIFRIPKFSYYFFQSQRPPVASTIEGVISGPMVYIASYWQSQSSLDVRVFSNCDEVSLHLNDQLIEKKGHDQDILSTNLAYPPFTFYVNEFKKGTLKAIGFINGKEMAVFSVKTPENPLALKLSYDLSNKQISRVGKDIIFIYAEIQDNNGTLCPENNLQVEFEVKGNATLIGDNPIKTEAGIATILLQTSVDSKRIVIGAKANGLKPDRMVIE